MFAPRIGADVVVNLEDAAEVAAAGEAALPGNGVELEVGKGQESHGVFEAEPSECGLRTFASGLPEKPAQMTDGDIDGLGDLVKFRLHRHVLAVPGEALLDFFQSVISPVLVGGERRFRQGDQRKLEQRFFEEHETFLGHASVGRAQFLLNFSEAAGLVGQQIAFEESALANDFLEEGRHLTEMKDRDLAAAGTFAFPTMRHLGWKDPEMMLVERWLIGVGEHGPTFATQHGEEFPVVALMDVHRVHAEAANSESHVSQHEVIMDQMAEFVKRLTSTLSMKSVKLLLTDWGECK